jgi:hypothetical protein
MEPDDRRTLLPLVPEMAATFFASETQKQTISRMTPAVISTIGFQKALLVDGFVCAWPRMTFAYSSIKDLLTRP